MKSLMLKLMENVKFRRIILILTVTVSVLAVYSNSVETPFQLDDQHMIEHSEKIKDINYHLQSRHWLKVKLNRILPNLTLALNYKFSGYDVKGYHITNIVIHILSSLAVYWFILLLFQFKVLAKEKISDYSEIIAFLGAMVFAVHPMQLQAVTYITQRLASIAGLFYILGAANYAKARLAHTQDKEIWKAAVFYFFVFVCFYFGARSKQNIITLPLALFAVEFFFVRNDEGKIFKKYVFYFIGVSLIAAIAYIFGIGVPKAPEAPSATAYFATQLRALIIYVGKLFLPVSLKLYYNLPFSKSLFGIKEILSFIVLSGILSAAVFLFNRTRLLSFGIVWFFITMLVESSIFPLKFSFFEYRVYPGMFGYAIFFASAIFYFNPKDLKFAVVIPALIILFYANGVVQNNKVWKDQILLWKDNVAKTTDFAIPYENVGTYYFKKGENDSAIVYFNKALQLDSTLSSSYLNRGLAYLLQGNYALALKDYNEALRYNDEFPLAYNNRGYLYLKLGKYDSAITDLKRAVSLGKKYHQAMGNLCIAYNSAGKYKEAFNIINKAIELDKNNANYYINRGNLHFSIGDFHVAAANYQKAFTLEDSNVKALNNFAIVQRALKNNKKAIQYSSKALEINPEFVPAYLNRALSEDALGRKEEALKDVDICLALSPNNINAQIIKGAILGKKKILLKVDPQFVFKIEKEMRDMKNPK